jgi:hypothetical protein
MAERIINRCDKSFIFDDKPQVESAISDWPNWVKSVRYFLDWAQWLILSSKRSVLYTSSAFVKLRKAVIPSRDIFFCIGHCNQRGCGGRNPRSCSPRGKLAWSFVSCYVRQYGMFWLLKHLLNNDVPAFLQQEYPQNLLLPLPFSRKTAWLKASLHFLLFPFLFSVSLFYFN